MLTDIIHGSWTKGRMVPGRPVLRSIPGLCGDQPYAARCYLIDQWEFQDPKMEVIIPFVSGLYKGYVRGYPHK